MTTTDLKLMNFYKEIPNRPVEKGDETLTSWNRDIFFYNIDKAERESDKVKTSYEDHRKVVETAVNIMGKNTQHDIAVCILTHRFFAPYRASVFGKEKDFITDYTFLLQKIGALFNPTTGTVKSSTIHSQLKEYTKPTLVQLNHLVGRVTAIGIKPHGDETLNELAQRLNVAAPESTTYAVAGLKVGM